mmetsp:Transcript_78937/g.255059  ORF Transcript_78937/g.255059 Transcript_78937/m.255059 type:complete len:247 (-) Transcript_78937:116-856(-)
MVGGVGLLALAKPPHRLRPARDCLQLCGFLRPTGPTRWPAGTGRRQQLQGGAAGDKPHVPLRAEGMGGAGGERLALRDQGDIPVWLQRQAGLVHEVEPTWRDSGYRLAGWICRGRQRKHSGLGRRAGPFHGALQRCRGRRLAEAAVGQAVACGQAAGADGRREGGVGPGLGSNGCCIARCWHRLRVRGQLLGGGRCRRAFYPAAGRELWYSEGAHSADGLVGPRPGATWSFQDHDAELVVVVVRGV